MKPILQIAELTSQPGNSERLIRLIIRWRTRKLVELQFISIASAILAGAVIGSFSWNAVADSYWLTSTFWYCSLVLSILGILLSAQQIAVLDLLGEPRSHGSRDTIANEAGRYLPLMLMEVKQSRRADSDIGVWKPRWKMVFIWQCPIMFLSYSVCLFLLGLTILVCTPLIRGGGWSTDYNVAIIYLAITAAASGTFVFCSFWVYYYVNPDYEFEHLSETDGKSPAQLPISSTEQATYTTHYKRDQEDMTDSIRASPYYDNRSS